MAVFVCIESQIALACILLNVSWTDKTMNPATSYKGLLLGMVFGLALGAFIDRIAIGIALGAALGYLYDAGYFRSKKSTSRTDSDAATPSANEDDGQR